VQLPRGPRKVTLPLRRFSHPPWCSYRGNWQHGQVYSVRQNFRSHMNPCSVLRPDQMPCESHLPFSMEPSRTILLQAAECVFNAFYAISDFKGTVHVQTRGQDLSIECLSFIPSHGSHIDSILGQLRMSAKKYHIPYSSPDPFPRVCQLQKPEGSWQRFANAFSSSESLAGLGSMSCSATSSSRSILIAFSSICMAFVVPVVTSLATCQFNSSPPFCLVTGIAVRCLAGRRNSPLECRISRSRNWRWASERNPTAASASRTARR
jgi:hypothetical protein